jgi:enterochelin esterase-like enzyme
MKPTLVLPFTLLLAVVVHGQDAAAGTPASSNVRGAEYPSIHPDLRVTFRLKAPEAQKMQVMPGGGANGLGKGPFDMTRTPDGAWSATIGPVAPGFHYYWLLIDGVPANDPASETFFGWGRQSSGIEVPDPTLDFYDWKDVPHGEIHIHYYRSAVTGQTRRAYIYTPPGYDADPRTRYPVLYLQHGAGESERGWTAQGRANFILDNLIAARKAVPMMIVMENGYASKLSAPGTSGTSGTGGAGVSRGTEGFDDLVIHDLIPEIDRSYRTRADRDHRAIAGLSMGGGEAMRTGLGHLDQFAWVGSFSGAQLPAASHAAFADPAAFNAKVKLFWLGCGTGDSLQAPALALHEALDRAGVHNVWFTGPGLHEWQVWRKHLREFAPRLFQ